MNGHVHILRQPRVPGGGRIVSVMLACVILAGTALAQPEPGGTRRRGQYLRTDVLKTEAENSYSCTLAPTSGSIPALLFRRQERLRHHEVRVYEVVLEERTTDAETGRESVVFRVSPGDEIRGETSTRETTRDMGPFADEPFEVNGVAIRTDSAGRFTDGTQMLLRPFDDLGTHAIDLQIRHRELPAQTIRVSRYLTLRWEGKRPDERLQLVQTDVLVSLGADFAPLSPVDRQGLRLEISVPETLVPGQDAVVRLSAVNAGKRPVSCLLGRLFSRHPWFSGVNFYLGNVPAGATRQFERVIRVPESAAPGPVFGVVGLWDILGAAETSALAVTTRVVPASSRP